MTKDEVAAAFVATRDRQAMAELLLRLRRLDVDRALFLLEGFCEQVMHISFVKGYAAAEAEFVKGLDNE